MNYFDEYTSKFDMENDNINYKYYHSYRVMDNMVILAKKLELSNEDIQLAKNIGLLHDIGRFEQYRLYKSFKDSNMDHGNYGADLLIKENLIEKFDIKKEDYQVVYKAIKNHNKFNIEKNLSNREMLFSKMIRDADKLDILHALAEVKYELIQDDNDISEDILNNFLINKQIKIKPSQSKNDDLATIFSLIYDINYDYTMSEIYKHKYYDKIFTRINDNNKQRFKGLLEHINKYLQERIDNDVR